MIYSRMSSMLCDKRVGLVLDVNEMTDTSTFLHANGFLYFFFTYIAGAFLKING